MVRVALVLLGCAGIAWSGDAETSLEAATEAARASGKIKPSDLDWVQSRWELYRDAEANLQAWVHGGQAPDETARRDALARLTQERIVELQHIARDGTSGDIPSGATLPAREGQAKQEMAQAYASLRGGVVTARQFGVVAALIESQKAWLTFTDLQASDDGHVRASPSASLASEARTDRLRAASLREDGAVLGFQPEAVASNQEADPGLDRETAISPDGKLRLEQNDKGKAWVISNETGKRVPLPPTDDETGKGRSVPTVPVSKYDFSPDGLWIVRTQKFYHGMCGGYLYGRPSSQTLAFVEATTEPLDVLAWKFFHKAHPQAAVRTNQGGVIRFVCWVPGGVRLSLNAAERLTWGDVNDWQVDYHFATKTFAVPAELQDHDAKAYPVSPSDRD